MIRANRAGYAQLSGCGLNLFTRDELDQIHYGTLEVLEEAGLMVFSDEAMEIYYSHGCKVDKEKKIVKIPPYIVEEAIKSAPSKILLAGRDPKHDLILEGTRVNFTNFGEGIKMLDMETGEVRESIKQDLVETAILCDALDNVDMFIVAVCPRDMPAIAQDLHAADAALNHTTKHFMNSILGTAETRRYVEMGAAIVGGKEELRRRPIISTAGDPVSPLQLSEEYSETIIESARAGIPCNILTMALAGSTTPVTLAGTLIVHNCEVLGGIVLSQLSSKGAPIIYGSSTTIFDLSCVNVPVGAPELGMMGAAVAKLAQYYNLPSFVAGGQADSKLPDAQAAHESTITALLPALAGVNLIYGLGMLESGMTWSHAKMVIDNEIAGMIRRTIQGIDVNDDTMAVDIIKQAHEIKDFLHQRHTIQHMREQSKPRLMDRNTRGAWEAKGGKDLTQAATEEARKILKTHQPEPLSDDVKKTLREIVASVEKEAVTV